MAANTAPFLGLLRDGFEKMYPLVKPQHAGSSHQTSLGVVSQWLLLRTFLTRRCGFSEWCVSLRGKGAKGEGHP